MFVVFFAMVVAVIAVLVWQCEIVDDTNRDLQQRHERNRESLTE